MEKLELQYPRVYPDGKSPFESSKIGRSITNPEQIQYCGMRNKVACANVFCDPNRIYEWKDTHEVKQELTQCPGSTMKVSTATRLRPTSSNVEYKTVQRLTNDGFYSVARTKNGKLIGGYEARPFTRKFAEGFKGKLQKFAINVATDSNGCERPVLKRIGNALFGLAKKIK